MDGVKPRFSADVTAPVSSRPDVLMSIRSVSGLSGRARCRHGIADENAESTGRQSKVNDNPRGLDHGMAELGGNQRPIWATTALLLVALDIVSN
jgi:hypothetical protein